MITRKRILALLFTAICLLGILPLSVSAHILAIPGTIYTFVNEDVLPPDPPFHNQPHYTPINGTLNYFTCEDSVEYEGTVSIDVFSSEILEIGYTANTDLYSVTMKVNVVASVYIQALSPYPMFIEEPAILAFTRLGNEPRVIVFVEVEGITITTSATSDISFVLTEILDSTDMSILNTTLQCFSADTSNLKSDNYVDWYLTFYNHIIDVFVNNAKIQYVMDNPIFIISLVVFAMAISFAVATFIFKIFRRY